MTQGYSSTTVAMKHQPMHRSSGAAQCHTCGRHQRSSRGFSGNTDTHRTSARTTRVDGVTSPSEDELGGIGQQLLESESAKAEASWLRQAYRCQSENKSGAHRAVNRTPQGPTRELHALSPSADAGRRPHVTLETTARVTARPYDRRFTKTTKPTNARRRVC